MVSKKQLQQPPLLKLGRFEKQEKKELYEKRKKNSVLSAFYDNPPGMFTVFDYLFLLRIGIFCEVRVNFIKHSGSIGKSEISGWWQLRDE